jgi:hypothetical protein
VGRGGGGACSACGNGRRFTSRPGAADAARGRIDTAWKPSGSGATVIRATLNQYCVFCHNDRVKTSGLSLQSLDVDRLGDHAATWERTWACAGPLADAPQIS